MYLVLQGLPWQIFLPYDHEKLWRLVVSPALGQALPCDGLLLLSQCDSYLTGLQ